MERSEDWRSKSREVGGLPDVTRERGQDDKEGRSDGCRCGGGAAASM